MSNAVCDAASPAIAASMKATPDLAPTRLAAARASPSMPVMASRTASAWSALATTWTVLDWSKRPCSARTFWPTIESNSFV